MKTYEEYIAEDWTPEQAAILAGRKDKPKRFKWTKEITQKALILQQEGYSCREIGEEIGTTKNAVIGKLSRLKAKGIKPKTTPKQPIRKKYLTRNERIAIITTVSGFRKRHGIAPRENPTNERPEPVIEHQDEVFIPLDERKGVQELGEHDCKWPVGDPKYDDDFHLCGQRQQDGEVYCQFHHSKSVRHRLIGAS